MKIDIGFLENGLLLGVCFYDNIIEIDLLFIAIVIEETDN